MSRDSFVKNKNAYDALVCTLDKVVDTRMRLPDQVFRNGLNRFLFAEFGRAMTDDFWTFLQFMRLNPNNEIINVAVLDYDPIEYAFPKIGDYNSFCLPLDASGSAYMSNLWSETEIGTTTEFDPMAIMAERIVWAPDTANWAVWADRGLEVCVLAYNIADSQHLASLKCPSFPYWEPVDAAVTTHMTNQFRDGIVPNEISHNLRVNYSNPSNER